MREKIKSKQIPLGQLVFGHKYGIDIYGTSLWFEFTFTRKNIQHLTCVGASGTRERMEISKRMLKKMINDRSVTRFVFEIMF